MYRFVCVWCVCAAWNQCIRDKGRVMRFVNIASSPGHSQILSRSRGEKSGEGLVPLLRHRPEMVDSVST